MKPIKSLFMKTYGRQKRKIPAWISPESRKQAFDSSLSTDGDISVFEPAKPARMRQRNLSVASCKAVRPAKKKAMRCLTENTGDEDMTSPCPQPAQLRKTTREKKTHVSCAKAARPVKRKAVLSLTETSSDEENIRRPSPPQPAPQTKMSSGGLPSAGRFVTRRRRAVAAKPKLPKATFSVVNSSDDFTSGAFDSSRILRPRRRRRQMIPPAFVVSSAENSMNAAGASNLAVNPLQEISLNELSDQSIGLCPRKPIFCSTPSANPTCKRPRLKPLSVNNQSATLPSISLSCIGGLNTFQEDMNCPGQLVSPPRPASPNAQSSLSKQEPTGDLLTKAKSSSCSDEAKCYGEDVKTKSVVELPSLNLLTTDDSECSSQFVSAAGGLEWLVVALKEKCLTKGCKVQLERLNELAVTQLCSQTAYSSCLRRSSSVHSQETQSEHPLTVVSIQTSEPSDSSEALFNLYLSVTNNKTDSYFQSTKSFESSEHAAATTDTQSSNNSPSVDCKNSAELSSSTKELSEQSKSVLLIESTQHTDGSIDFIVGTQLPNSKPQDALLTEEEAAAVEGNIRKCSVQVEKLILTQKTVQHLQVFMQQKEGRLSGDANSDINASECNVTGPEDATCSGVTTESSVADTEQAMNNCTSTAQTQEAGKKAAVLRNMLKDECVSDKLTVKIQRLSLSQLKAPADVSCDLSSDDRRENRHQTESDSLSVRSRSVSTSSEEKAASDKGAGKNSLNVSHKRKKASLAPKDKRKRSTSSDRPGTGRKACVSGLSVSRWKSKDATNACAFGSRTAQTGGVKAADCSINELISTQRKQPRAPCGSAMNFVTPEKTSRLNLSSLLADLTPNTHTWSRLKAALSVHRKVLLTPKTSHLLGFGTPGRAELDISQDLFATPFRPSVNRRFQSQLLSHTPVESEDASLSDAEKVYAECGQQRPLPWEQCILPPRMKQCMKIGEGTFGEVFSTTNTSGATVALKIIPVEGNEKVNGEDQKSFGEILHEIIISKELSSLKEKQQNQTHGFIGLNDLHCVQGCYPPDFLHAWDKFDEQKGSENDRPDFFGNEQLFIILEFEFGGTDLENSNGTLPSLGVAKSILHQVTAALAVAEQELHFEHRDLHWGNVLVKTTKEKKASFLLNGVDHSLETKGVLVRIIDYSLSRLEIDDLTVSCDISKDEELFMGQGDYQFDIYRLMRQENGNDWSNFHPRTNVLWLHYLCSKLLSMKYRSSGGRGAKDMREALTRFYDNVLQYSSAVDVLHNWPMFQ
ncbi:uncharacterized protein V6R79_018060 [Siganus canaliculatus]